MKIKINPAGGVDRWSSRVPTINIRDVGGAASVSFGTGTSLMNKKQFGKLVDQLAVVHEHWDIWFGAEEKKLEAPRAGVGELHSTYAARWRNRSEP